MQNNLVDVFYILDFDRTLADTDALQALHVQMSEEGRNKSTEEVYEQFIASAQHKDMLLPSAHELLRKLVEKNVPFGILTTGERAWQEAKIQASGLGETPHFILDFYEKGSLIASWRQTNGTYVMPPEITGKEGVEARSLVFIDDKVVSFANLPGDVKGIRIAVIGSQTVEAENKLPPNVQQVASLDQAIKILFP